MSTSFSRAPHIQGPERHKHPSEAPNAALLVDFDNVTMGMRSDLSKELKSLLNSDIIKGKVTVQRAYADWRRYPQYIVPLSEASIDLIFAPAYGSSKKNATDIRMAIDGMELVFTRPEIGTYILLTGDSDFSSLVLKLKEYGKYVIGVGIQESSSDILVQNCDEYYSYTSISGLRKSTDAAPSAGDPWVLVEKALERMANRKDVMRSDRLKQVMLELDPGFDEKEIGYSKFSRFLTEAAQKGLLQLRKLDNGQYELKGGAGSPASSRSPAPKSRGRDGSRDGGRGGKRSSPRSSAPSEPAPTATASTASTGPKDLASAYKLLLKALGEIMDDQGEDSVRDSDVKRRMLALDSSFDEAELGFGKFSLFLRQAHDQEVITLRKGDEGNYHVSPGGGGIAAPGGDEPSEASEAASETTGDGARTPAPETESASQDQVRRLRPRTEASRRGGGDEPPPIFEGQTVRAPGAGRGGRPSRETVDSPKAGTDGPTVPAGEVLDPEALRLPTGRTSMIKYLSNSYGGVGEKTAETLVDALGDDLFRVLQSQPDRVSELLPPSRAEKVLEAWRADFARRRERYLKSDQAEQRSGEARQKPRSPGGGQGRRPDRRGEKPAAPSTSEPLASSASSSPAEPSAPADPSAPDHTRVERHEERSADEPGLFGRTREADPDETERKEAEPSEESEKEEPVSAFGGIASLFRRKPRGSRGESGSD